MCLNTFTQHTHAYVCTHAQSQTHSQAAIHVHVHQNSGAIQPLPWFLSCAQSQESIFSPRDITSLHLLSFLPVSHFSIWKVVPTINRICPTPGHTPFPPTLRRKKKSHSKNGLLSPCPMPVVTNISSDNLGDQLQRSRCTLE